MARFSIDGESVLAAADAVQRLGAGLDAAPVAAALRSAGAALPGGAVEAVTGAEAAEWAAEVTALGEALQAWSAAVERAARSARAIDAAGAEALRRGGP